MTDNDTTELTLPNEKGKDPIVIQKYRDVFKTLNSMEDSKAEYALLGIEDQTLINYAMTPKDLLYNSLLYAERITRIAKAHQRVGDKATSSEFLSGFHKDDKLKPVITIVIYWGADEWDAATSVHEMIDTNDAELLRFVPDYRITVISPFSLSNDDFNKFHSELREVLKYIKYSKNSDDLEKYVAEDESYRHLSKEAVDVINAMTKSGIEIKDGEEKVDVCKAIQDMKEKAMLEEKKKTIRNMIKDGVSFENIAKYTDCTVEFVEMVASEMSAA